MKLVLALLLSTICFPVMAAVPTFSVEKLIWYVLVLIGLGIVFGLLYLLVEKAPRLTEGWKQGIKYFILVVVVLVVIGVIMDFIGHPIMKFT